MGKANSRGFRSALTMGAVLGLAVTVTGLGSRGAVSADSEPEQSLRLAQVIDGFPGRSPGIGSSGPGFGRPGGQSAFQSGRQGVLGTQGIQGGVFSSNSSGVVPVGRSMPLVAFCTDLLSEPPDATTRFRGGEKARVTLADGRNVSLASALESGLVAMRGRNEALNPFRPGGLALSLELVNTSPVPVRVDIPASEAVTPTGQAEQPLPANSERLFAVAAEERLSQSNTMQYAVWAARGSTAEEVEQANMTRLPAAETTRVQGLLDESGIARKFDRERGAYAAKYRSAMEKLGSEAAALNGTASLPSGGTAEVEAVRGAENGGLITVHRDGGDFYYRAEFRDRKDGKLDVTLKHLVTGRRIHPFRGYLLVKPA